MCKEEQEFVCFIEAKADEEEQQVKQKSSKALDSRSKRTSLFRYNALSLLPVVVLVGTFSVISFYLGRQQGTNHQYAATPYHHREDPMNSLRSQAALATIQIMQNDTKEAAEESYLVNIGSLADIVDQALDTVGFRRVFLELFETYSFTRATFSAAKVLGEDKFTMAVMNKAQMRPEAIYNGLPGDRWPKHTDVCTACLPALHHWVGAIAADKLLRDGSLLFDATTGERLSTPRTVMAELQRMAMEEEPPDMVPYHSQHGFVWQYIPKAAPNFLETFPSDLAIEMCGHHIWDIRGNRTYSIIPSLSVARECSHGLGHAVYYALAMRQLGRKRQDYSARMQFRTRGGFILDDEYLCEAVRMCKQAPGHDTYHLCVYGVSHAYYEVSLGHNMSEHSFDVFRNVCGFKQEGDD